MIVCRATTPFKFDKMGEALELSRKMCAWYKEKGSTVRMYTAYYAQYDVIVVEYEAETLGDLQKLDQEFWAEADQTEIKKWHEIGVRGRTSEAWVRHEV